MVYVAYFLLPIELTGSIRTQNITGCVHANCGFKYSIPPTKFITNPLVRPAKADFLFGYTYSGYATLQKAVDDFILNNASSQGHVTTTVSYHHTV